MALVCLGYDASFELEKGSIKDASRTAALLFDPSGQYWPHCSILVRPFTHEKGKAHHPAFARQWFGKGYHLHRGHVELPTRSLERWRSVGRVRRIFYTRGSGDDRKAENAGDYEHTFGERGLFEVFTFSGKRDLPELFWLGNVLRLELGRGCVVDRRGFVVP
jgi:hypothetical protein